MTLLAIIRCKFWLWRTRRDVARASKQPSAMIRRSQDRRTVL